MALSDDLTKLAARAKEAEDRTAAARDKARADLEREDRAGRDGDQHFAATRLAARGRGSSASHPGLDSGHTGRRSTCGLRRRFVLVDDRPLTAHDAVAPAVDRRRAHAIHRDVSGLVTDEPARAWTTSRCASTHCSA